MESFELTDFISVELAVLRKPGNGSVLRAVNTTHHAPHNWVVAYLGSNERSKPSQGQMT